MEDELQDPRLILEVTDWGALVGSSPFSVPDVLARLEGILSADRGAVTAGIDCLWDDLLHQGTPELATVPAARYVAGVLAAPVGDDSAALIWRSGSHSLRARLLCWLVEVAYSVGSLRTMHLLEWFGDDAGQEGPVVDGLRAIRPDLLQGVVPWISDSTSEVREAALLAAMHIADDPRLASYRSELATLITAQLMASASPTHSSARSASMLIASWGEDAEELMAIAEPIKTKEVLVEEFWGGDRGSLDEPPF